MPDDTREAFIMPSPDVQISIRSSTSWIEDVSIDSDTLRYVCGGRGEQVIFWSKELGIPLLSRDIEHSIEEKNDVYIIKVQNKTAFEEVVLYGR